MWSGAFDKPLRIEIAVSRYLAASLITVHLLGLFAAVFGPWPVAVRCLLSAVIVLSAAAVAWRHLLAGRITVAVWLPDGRWRVFGGVGWQDARLGPGVRWSTLWVVLPLQMRGARRRMLFLGRDGVDPDAFRRLRARLTVA
ncbi:MAG: hypothetical protein E2O56_03515, partial [Gammaproteobacteria bacterium]